MRCFTVLLLFVVLSASAQNYTSFFVGNNTDIVTQPLGGVCLMGGASEEDEAVKWFLQRAQGGDVVVLRASGSDGYNDYFYSELGITVNSVETILFNDATAATESYIIDKINKAEAIWLAGGDQWDYVSYWRNSPIDAALNEAINVRKAVVGGTSAGMAVLGSHYFTAQNGTITSAAALGNPYANNATVSSDPFIKVPYLDNLITDTHFDSPDRKGRLLAFMARTLTDSQVRLRAIACDEYTAVCVDENGLAHVYGQHPNYDDNAYFLQVNCDLNDVTPETCLPNTNLTWNRNGQAVSVYAVKGTLAGSNTFDLTDWKTGNGGTWQFWSVNNGVVAESAGTAPVCTTSATDQNPFSILVLPNPVSGVLAIATEEPVVHVAVFDMSGRLMLEQTFSQPTLSSTLNTHSLPTGTYRLHIKTKAGTAASILVKQ